MKILIFKTNINNEQKFNKVKLRFNNIPYIQQWSIDSEYIDKALRIEASGFTKESDIIKTLNEIKHLL